MDEKKDITSRSIPSTQSTILEQGDIFFFYRPKVRSEKVQSIVDVRRFFMVLAPCFGGIYVLTLGASTLES